MKPEIKLALAYFANTQMQIELIDELKMTRLYKHKIKNLSNQIQKENEILISNLFEGLNEDAEMYFHKSVEMVEILIDSIKNGKIEILIQLLKEYKEGNISIVDENKHSKMLNQMDKLK
tara:strand:- start:86 stop:442 length:357 start_codon:yes stop_codon:yes gene_type:complete